MKRISCLVSLSGAIALGLLSGRSIVARDSGWRAGLDTSEAKYTVQVPDGLAFAEFKGYESWQVSPLATAATCSR